MTHIRGHIDDPPESCGRLREVDYTTGQPKGAKIDFIPPNWGPIAAGMTVGFHLTETHNKSLKIAYDVIPWGLHDDSEKALIDLASNIGVSIGKIEDLPHEKFNAIRSKLEHAELADDIKDTIRKSLDYMMGPDFGKVHMNA